MVLVKRALLSLLLLALCIIPISAEMVTDSITIDNTYWTAPEGVTMINAEVIGAGGSGNSGGFVYQIGSPTTYYSAWAGGGGLVGKANTYNNIVVVPGTSYLVRVGLPGASLQGTLTTCPATGSSNLYVPTEGFASSWAGGPSSITVNGTTYSSAGGHVGNLTIACSAGSMPTITAMNNWNVIGQTGYVIQSALALPGVTSAYGVGGSGGAGYGAGGGGGGKGGLYTDPFGGGGSSGVGAQGIVRISYDLETASGVSQQGYPHYVTFKVISGFGAPISDVVVNATGVNTSTGDFDFIPQLMGIPLNEVPVGTAEMSMSTDSEGAVTFYMVPTVKYNMTFTKAGYTITPRLLTPQDNTYIVYADSASFTVDGNKLGGINISLSAAAINTTHAFLNLTYDDTTTSTTGGVITIYKDSTSRTESTTAVAIMPVTGDSFTNSTVVVVGTTGSSYRVVVNATTDTGQYISTFAHQFKGNGIDIPGFDAETQLWLALFIIIFTAAFAGATHSPQMAVVLCVESWIFWAVGWLDALVSEFNYGEESLIMVLIMASFFAVMWNVTEAKAKGKRSS